LKEQLVQIGIDPGVVEQASASLSNAQSECQALINQVMQAKNTLDSSMNAAFSSFRTADSGWTAGQGKVAFDEAQLRLRGVMNQLDEQIAALQAPAQNLESEITRFKTALANSATTMQETDSQIAGAWSGA
jgi:uncharacterized protein YukE